MTDIRLVEVTGHNVREACALRVKPEQTGLVAPVADSLAEAHAAGEVAWPRLIYDGDELVGFVMGGFAPPPAPPIFRSCIWRLLVSADHQGKGYGRFAVLGVIDEARRRGYRRLTALWSPAGSGPEQFYLRLGFRRLPDWDGHGEVPGELYFA